MRTALPALLVALAALAACSVEPTPLPTEAAVAELDRAAQPPLYQLLYDAPLAPAPSAVQQRVRLLIWLRHMDLSTSQLARLEELRVAALERSRRIDQAEAQVAERYAAEEERVYTELWELLRSGTPVDDPQMTVATEALRELRAGGARERELLRVRLEGIRGLLEAERPFLQTLSPGQEQLMADSLFALRHALDPIATPGTFRELVGTTYDPGQYAVLTRGTGEVDREPLDIGGLWSDEPGLDGHALHGARREVLLFLLVQQPGLDEAIAEAMTQAREAPEGSPQGGPPPGAPPPEGAAPPGAPQPQGGVAPGTPQPEGAAPPPEGAAPPGAPQPAGAGAPGSP